MADVELLPLPEPGMLHAGEPREWFTADQVHAYADARVAQATEPLLALVAEWERVAVAQAELHGEAEARAELLAEALREKVWELRSQSSSDDQSSDYERGEHAARADLAYELEALLRDQKDRNG